MKDGSDETAVQRLPGEDDDRDGKRRGGSALRAASSCLKKTRRSKRKRHVSKDEVQCAQKMYAWRIPVVAQRHAAEHM